MRISKIPKLFIIDHGIIEKIKFYHGVSCRLPAGRFDPLPVRNSDVRQTIFLQSNWSVLNGFWLPGNIIKDRNICRHSLEIRGCVFFSPLIGCKWVQCGGPLGLGKEFLCIPLSLSPFEFRRGDGKQERKSETVSHTDRPRCDAWLISLVKYVFWLWISKTVWIVPSHHLPSTEEPFYKILTLGVKATLNVLNLPTHYYVYMIIT